MRYRKKPVAVDAYQYQGHTYEHRADWPDWLIDAWNTNPIHRGAVYQFHPTSGGTALAVRTLEGTVVVSKGSWIVRGSVGELWPVRQDIFAATYEPAE